MPLLQSPLQHTIQSQSHPPPVVTNYFILILGLSSRFLLAYRRGYFPRGFLIKILCMSWLPIQILLLRLTESIGLNGKFLRFSNEKSTIFLNIFTIFNQLYNFHCLLLPSPNVSQAFQFRSCKNFLFCLSHLFENVKNFPFNPILIDYTAHCTIKCLNTKSNTYLNIKFIRSHLGILSLLCLTCFRFGIKGLWDHHAVYVCVWVYPLSTFEILTDFHEIYYKRYAVGGPPTSYWYFLIYYNQ
jgi:hypothetical protein